MAELSRPREKVKKKESVSKPKTKGKTEPKRTIPECTAIDVPTHSKNLEELPTPLSVTGNPHIEATDFQEDERHCVDDKLLNYNKETLKVEKKQEEESSIRVSTVSAGSTSMYLNLQSDLRNLELTQNNIPHYVASAPIMTEDESLDDVNKVEHEAEVANENESIRTNKESVVHRKIGSRIVVAEENAHVRPFTETQLKSLYYNRELHLNDSYVEKFIEIYRCHDSHEFHALVAGYQRSRMELKSTIQKYEETKHSYNSKIELIWSTVNQVAKATAKCRDGNVVTGSQDYVKAVYNSEYTEEIKSLLLNIQSIVSETYALHAYQVELSKLQVDSYLYRLVSASQFLSGLPRNAPAQVYFPESRPAELFSHVENIKYCISILFAFQRQLEKDTQFTEDSRQWLNKLVALLLRVGTFEDHLFILNHVLRCPAGISNWAASYVQIPLPLAANGPYPLGGPFLDHVMTVMATLLLPVKAREDFLKNLNMETSITANEDNDAKWVLVDSEGEEDEDPKNCWLHLRENDLVSVLNQIPIGALFKQLLGVFTINDIDYYDNRFITDQEMMRLFSVATQLVRLFRESFKTYNLSRYKQFTKRVSQFIRHLVTNVTDHLQAFLRLCNEDASFVRLRLMAEYDQFFLRSAYSIFSSQRKGAWQFMAAMPYTMVSVEMLWKILWLLHNDYEEDLESIEQDLSVVGWQKKMSDQHLHLKFEERLSSLPENEAYFLLTAFANMAASRSDQDRGFIETICGEVFQISFINETSKDVCFKWGRELLSSLGVKHQFIMSVLLQEVTLNIEKLGKAAIYLFQELPIYLWKPTQDDIEILTKWLKECPLGSNESQFAQIVFHQINWGLDATGEHLFLDVLLHRQIALVIWESYQTQIPATKSGPIYESIKQITSIAAALKSGISSVDIFKSWAWKMIRTLKIHNHDIPVNVTKTTSNPIKIPDMLQDAEFQSLRWNVREKNPFAIFVAFKLTNVGHCIAEVCQNMSYLQYLLEQQCFEGVIDLLYLITPLFFTCGHYLWTNKTFMSVIQNLLVCDSTYLKMAKSMVVSTFPGIYLQLIANMIEAQFQNSEKMNWPSEIISAFWIETFTTLPNWFKNEAVLYLLDNICMSTFLGNDDLKQAVLSKKFQLLMGKIDGKSESSHQGASGTFSSFFSWVTTGAGIPFTLIQKDTVKKYPWLAYILLEMETQTGHEVKVWRFIVKELMANSSSMPELALKKIATKDDLMAPPVHHLPIYRWALAAFDLNNECPIAPLYWQKFFIYYLQRPVQTSGNSVCAGVGQRFFSDMNDVFVLKKLKQKLKDLILHHEKQKQIMASLNDSNEDLNLQSDGGERENLRSRELLHDKLLSLFRAMSLWLEEPQLHEPIPYLSSLLIDYDPSRLSLLIEQNCKKPWFEFLHSNEIHDRRSNLASPWNQRYFSKRDWKKAVLKTDRNDSNFQGDIEVMLKRLRAHEEPAPPPPICPLKPVVPELPNDIFDSGKVVREGLTPYFSVLTDFARVFSNRLANHAALDCAYLELLPQIYQNVEVEVEISVFCQKGQSSFHLSSDSGCLGPANIRLKFFEMKEIVSAKTLLTQNRSEWLTSINESLLGPPQNLCCSAVFVESAITQLLNFYKRNLESRNGVIASKYREVGLNLFYQLCGIMDSDSDLYPPTKQLMTSCLEILGQELIRNTGDQSTHILQMIIDCPRLINLLSPHFHPAMSGIETFILLYQRVISLHKIQTANFASVILSKFDLKTWLIMNKPKINDRVELFNLISNALSDLGADIKDELEMIAELYCQHLVTLLCYQFPDMYRDTLQLLMKGLQNDNLSTSVWYHVFNAFLFNDSSCVNLTDETISGHTTQHDINSICVHFAEVQELFTLNQIQETLDVFGKQLYDFRTSSTNHLLQTLYEKCHRYIKPVTIFLNLMCHCYVGIIKKEFVGNSIHSSVIVDMWTCFEKAFAPWMLPVLINNEYWSPWKIGQETTANDVVGVFVDCVSYAVTNLYASTNMLSIVLKLYWDYYAKSHVKDFVLNSINCSLLNLPWNTFWPDVSSIDLMTQILNGGIGECLDFLGGVFLQIGWPEVVHHFVQTDTSANLVTLTKVVGNLLHLHIRLGLASPILLQNQAMPRIMNAATTYPWRLLSSDVYNGTVQCFKRDCEFRCVLDGHHKQAALLNLLQTAAEFVPGTKALYPDVIKKRKSFVTLKVFLLTKCATNSNDLNSRMDYFKDTITDLLSHAEAVMITGPPNEDLFNESVIIVTEILNIFNLTSIKKLQDIALKAVQDWTKAHPQSSILRPILFAASRCIVLPFFMAHVIESTLESYFSLGVVENASSQWPHMETAMKVPTLIQQSLISECILQGLFFTLHALFGLLLSSANTVDEQWKILGQLIKTLNQIKPTEENEYKVILLWWRILSVVQSSIGKVDDIAISHLLIDLSTIVNVMGEDRSSQGLLSYIGFGKKSSLSLNLRFFARVLNVFILKQACHFELKSGSGYLIGKTNLAKQIGTAMDLLQATINNKNNDSYKSKSMLVHKYINNPNVELKEYKELIGVLVKELYPERYCLKFLIEDLTYV